MSSIDDEDDEPSRLWPGLVATGLVIAIVLVVLGFLGRVHPLGDSIAVGRIFAVSAVMVLGIIASLIGMRRVAWWSILFAMTAGAPVILAQILPGPLGQVAVYQKNMKYRNSDLAGLEADIRAADPQALTLQEVSQQNLALLEALADLLPHQHVCPSAGVGGPAVASRMAPVPGATVCAPGMAAMQVVWPGPQGDVPVWIVSVHLHWPWPYSQAEHAAELRPILSGLDGAVLMAGDFNMVPWGASVQGLAAAARTVRAGPSLGTFLGFDPVMRLPIDHAFAPSGGQITLRGAHGSDHLGLLAWLEP